MDLHSHLKIGPTSPFYNCPYSHINKIAFLGATVSYWFICSPGSCPSSSLCLYIPYLHSLLAHPENRDSTFLWNVNTSVPTVQSHIPENTNLQIHCNENLKFSSFTLISSIIYTKSSEIKYIFFFTA